MLILRMSELEKEIMDMYSSKGSQQQLSPSSLPVTVLDCVKMTVLTFRNLVWREVADS